MTHATADIRALLHSRPGMTVDELYHALCREVPRLTIMRTLYRMRNRGELTREEVANPLAGTGRGRRAVVMSWRATQ